MKLKLKTIDILLLVIPLIIAAVFYPMLPARIPRQFSFTGKPTTYMNKEFLFIIALLPFVAYKYYQARHRS